MEKNDPGRDPSYAGVIASRRERDCALGAVALTAQREAFE